MFSRKNVWPIFVILIFLLAFGIFNFFWSKPNSTLGISLAETSLGQITEVATASPSAFIDLTIPYLRDRHYDSYLGELIKQRAVTSYTSYLTHYSSDGFRVNGLLTIPSGEMPAGGWPAVVFIHGYIPPTLYKTQEKYVDYVNYLASRGMVVFKIDLRGHGNSEGEAQGAYYSGDYVIDVLNAYSALVNSGFVHQEKIGLWGHSMAGNVVLRTMAAKPDIPAGVIWAGAVFTYEDFQKFGIRDNSYRPPTDNTNRQRRRQQLFDTYGQFNLESGFWRQVSPVNYLTDLAGAIQLHHSVNDVVVSVEYSRNLSNVLKSMNVPHEYIEYTSGGHNLTNPAFGQAMKKTIDFYSQELGF